MTGIGIDAVTELLDTMPALGVSAGTAIVADSLWVITCNTK